MPAAPEAVSSPAAAPASAVAALPSITAKWLEHGHTLVSNNTGSPALIAVRWEQQTADGWVTFDVKQKLLPPFSSGQYEPRCWPPGVNRVTVPGSGLWNVEPYLPHEPGTGAPPLGCLTR